MFQVKLYKKFGHHYEIEVVGHVSNVLPTTTIRKSKCCQQTCELSLTGLSLILQLPKDQQSPVTQASDQFNLIAAEKRHFILAKMKVVTLARWEREHKQQERRRQMLMKAKEKKMHEREARKRKETEERVKEQVLDDHVSDFVQQLERNEKETNKMISKWMKSFLNQSENE